MILRRLGPVAARWSRGIGALVLVAGLLVGTVGTSAQPEPAKKGKPKPATSFSLVRSGAATTQGCLAKAKGRVKIFELGFAERMQVRLAGLPKNTEFDLFVIQVPDAPFGLAWYQGDMRTNKKGEAKKSFVGRFNEETFIVGLPPSQPAPVVHGDGSFPDAATNPPVPNPVHTAHVGLWFNSPAAAAKAGCGNAVTPFNGDHAAGVQVLSTRQFPPTAGPLLQVKS